MYTDWPNVVYLAAKELQQHNKLVVTVFYASDFPCLTLTTTIVLSFTLCLNHAAAAALGFLGCLRPGETHGGI